MATGADDPEIDPGILDQNLQDQNDEIVALESIFTNTGRFRVIARPDQTDSSDDKTPEPGQHADTKQFVIQLDIMVEHRDEGMRVDVWLPYDEHDDKPTVSAMTPVPKPQYERTVSGNRWRTSFHVSYLTPLCLEVTLPSSYPSHTPPQYTLTCPWIDTDHIKQLMHQLDQLWVDTAGMPVIYTWLDWLQNNVLSTMCIEDIVSLVATEADPEPSDISRAINDILQYNCMREQEVFVREMQTCGVCFDEKIGAEFFRLSECRHHFCADCMALYCEFHVKEGTVRQLTCPEPKCNVALAPSVLEAVLDEEAFQRWERLTLEKGLSTMGDIQWCPRCNHPVIEEDEKNLKLAVCTTCVYSFCTKCLDPWHQGIKCINDSDDEEEEKEEDKNLSKRQIKRLRHNRHIENKMSRSVIRSMAKYCPSCKAPIVKNLGCNKVLCINCYMSMCWVCGKAVEGYDHFKSCSLWEPDMPTLMPLDVRPMAEARRRVQNHQNDNPDEGRRALSKCPQCKTVNLKQKRNNHIRCFNCNKDFCFLCSKVLQTPIMAHFMNRECVQHSD